MPRHPVHRRPNPRKPRPRRSHAQLTIPQKSLAPLSASGKRKALLPADRKPPPAWNAAGRRKAHIWSATSWSTWAANIASSPFTRMTARPAIIHTSHFPIPAQSRATGGIVIKGNLWTYDSSFTANGKTTMIRTTNEFTDAKTEVFKVASSEDNGANWKIMLQGVAHKIAD